MIKNHFLIAYRTLKRNTGTTLINLVGLSISLAVFIIIVQFVSFELSYDDFHAEGDYLYRVESQFYKNDVLMDDWATSSSGYGKALEHEFPEITGMTRIWLWNRARVVQYEDTKYREKNVVAADASFFQLFSYPLLSGNPREVLAEPNTAYTSG